MGNGKHDDIKLTLSGLSCPPLPVPSTLSTPSHMPSGEDEESEIVTTIPSLVWHPLRPEVQRGRGFLSLCTCQSSFLLMHSCWVSYYN